MEGSTPWTGPCRSRARPGYLHWSSGSRRPCADVTLTVDGDLERLPATAGLAVYRILQEALTNVIRHAPGAPTSARLVGSENGRPR